MNRTQASAKAKELHGKGMTREQIAKELSKAGWKTKEGKSYGVSHISNLLNHGGKKKHTKSLAQIESIRKILSMFNLCPKTRVNMIKQVIED